MKSSDALGKTSTSTSTSTEQSPPSPDHPVAPTCCPNMLQIFIYPNHDHDHDRDPAHIRQLEVQLRSQQRMMANVGPDGVGPKCCHSPHCGDSTTLFPFYAARASNSDRHTPCRKTTWYPQAPPAARTSEPEELRFGVSLSYGPMAHHDFWSREVLSLEVDVAPFLSTCFHDALT